MRAVASIAANDAALGAMVAEAFERAGNHGIVAVEFGSTVETTLEVVEGMAFERGYLSHHMVTDVERMQVVLDDPFILMTDHKIVTMDQLNGVLVDDREERSAAADHCGGSRASRHHAVAGATRKDQLQGRGDPPAGIWPLAQGHAGGHRDHHRRQVISVDLGGKLEKARTAGPRLARARCGSPSTKTLITAGGGEPRKISARREQVMRQYEAAPENIERDKFQERIAKLSGGTAMILAGGATPVEQKRRTQLIEDSINATRAAIEEGIVPGGGIALLQDRAATRRHDRSGWRGVRDRAPSCCNARSAGRCSTSPPTPAWTARRKWRRPPRAGTGTASTRATARRSTWSRPASSIR